MSKRPVKPQKQEPETTGHVWDGIEEWNNPLPRWWLWCFYLTIAWGVLYTIAYPAWPMINQATQGFLGQNTRADVAAEIAMFQEANAPIQAKLVETELTEIGADPELNSYAQNAGAAIFRTWCAQCHGAGANGAEGGYPSLLDDDWLWGGTIEDIYLTVAHGIRNDESDEARYSEMPKFGEILEPEEIGQVVEYTLSLSGQDHDAAMAEPGAVIFEEQCSGCHLEDGTGDVFSGAPNLTDAIWLYGGDKETVTESVVNARFGVMPSWQNRLSEAEVRAVSIFVHSRGGGE